MSFKWTNENKDFLPGDDPKDGLPPMPDEWFDGERERAEIKFTKCSHKLELISGSEARCTRCGVGYMGMNVIELVRSSHLKRSGKK